jgi:hypothetical protein
VYARGGFDDTVVWLFRITYGLLRSSGPAVRNLFWSTTLKLIYFDEATRTPFLPDIV